LYLILNELPTRQGCHLSPRLSVLPLPRYRLNLHYLMVGQFPRIRNAPTYPSFSVLGSTAHLPDLALALLLLPHRTSTEQHLVRAIAVIWKDNPHNRLGF